jgi:DNA polymerase-3 subunit beta
MLVTVNRAELLAELGPMLGVSERRTTIPALSHVLLRIEEDGLFMAATDLDVSLTSFCDGQVEGSAGGSLSVPAKKFLEIIRAASGDDVKLHLDDNQIRIGSGSANFKIRGLSAAEFPNLPEVTGDPLAIPFRTLKTMIGKIFFAISIEDSRFQLAGALMQFGEDTIALAATDGHRLALVENKIEGAKERQSIIIPRKALQELQKFQGEDLEFVASDHHLSFKVGRRQLICRILEGTFPDFERVIARNNDKIVIVDRKRFSAMIQRIALMTGERARAVRLELKSLPEGVLALSAANPDLGEAREEMSINYDGGYLEIGLNPDYLVQVLGAIDTDMVRLELKDAGSQCLTMPNEGLEIRHICVIMPIRL